MYMKRHLHISLKFIIVHIRSVCFVLGMNFNIPTIHKRDVYHDYPVSGHVTVSYCKFGILTHFHTFYTKKSEVKKKQHFKG